jgi:hypothetical protein
MTSRGTGGPATVAGLDFRGSWSYTVRPAMPCPPPAADPTLRLQVGHIRASGGLEEEPAYGRTDVEDVHI